MHQQASFQNQFLIAMPQQHDQYFNEALIYICEHDSQGAMGLIVNKPLPINLSALVEQLGLQASTEQKQAAREELHFQESVFYGGPCQSNHGFILHTGGMAWSSSIAITESLVLTSSKEILTNIVLGKGPEQYLLALGYAGWDAGQLENEMTSNVWLNVDADIDTIFNMKPENRWHHAAASLGIDIHLLSADSGFA
jgi:putative transcriptional regulator